MNRVLYAATRFAEENLATMARGWQMLKDDGWMVVAQHNDLGAKRLDAVLKQLSPQRQSLSKFHCRAIAVQKTPDADAGLIEQWLYADAMQQVEDVPLHAAAGMFSWRKVDKGSRFLVESLPATLTGRGADIAAGWGYLSWALLQSHPQIAHITLYEAEKRALDMAERNLAAHVDRCRFVWCDATRPLDNAGQGFDWAVMNPPAHDLLQTTPEASAAIFAATVKALKPGGTLYMVANRHLPYERTLDQLFSHLAITHENHEFKIIEAVR
jgi:16S rRNA (guanine1207-N2)-methyltransferase